MRANLAHHSEEIFKSNLYFFFKHIVLGSILSTAVLKLYAMECSSHNISNHPVSIQLRKFR